VEFEQMSSTNRSIIVDAKRWVVKVGSALLTNNGQGLDIQAITRLVDQIEQLLKADKEVVLVSSGAVAAGIRKLGLKGRPDKIHQLQAAAAVGQMSLVQAYETQFQKYQRHTAQILLTHDDLSNRKRYLNARNTLLTLIDMGVLAVINENDTVVTDEIRFGDNDNLAALVANLIQADVMVILTNKNGMYEQDPRDNPAAKLLTDIDANDERLFSMASGSKDGLGRGGMITKVQSAALASRSGACTLIANGAESNILMRLAQGENLGTLFRSNRSIESARKQWLASHLQMSGQLILDDGAVKVLKNNDKSLLAVGVLEVKGDFARGEMVLCCDTQGKAVARGLVNYAAEDARKIAGKSSEAIESILGYMDEPELINRDNLVLV